MSHPAECNCQPGGAFSACLLLVDVSSLSTDMPHTKQASSRCTQHLLWARLARDSCLVSIHSSVASIHPVVRPPRSASNSPSVGLTSEASIRGGAFDYSMCSFCGAPRSDAPRGRHVNPAGAHRLCDPHCAPSSRGCDSTGVSWGTTDLANDTLQIVVEHNSQSPPAAMGE